MSGKGCRLSDAFWLQRDTATIERRAEEDAARTQKAVDNTQKVVERTVENIKDAFN
jgi:hypothetical protein